jgi:hypothetical protein
MQPASTVMVALSASIARTRSMRPVASTMASWCIGTPPPQAPVLPPCGTTATPRALHSASTCETSCVLRGRTTACAWPCHRRRSSIM